MCPKPIPLICSFAVVTGLFGAPAAADSPTLVVQWNAALLQGVRDSRLGPPMVARALAIAHTCMYDAWAAYDNQAIGTVLGGTLRRPAQERLPENVESAISYAAYRCAVNLFPGDKATVFDPLMAQLKLDPANTSTDTSTPPGIGNVAAAAVIASRANDGSNQSGSLTPSGVPYADYTNYKPVNGPSGVPVIPATVTDVNLWQPLQYTDATGAFVTQAYLGPYWGRVKPFALTSGEQFRALVAQRGPMRSDSPEFVSQARALIDLSANLTEAQKMIAEYWADGPNSETPPGHWALFAQFVSARDRNSLDEDVRLFFALSNAVFDAGIAAWDAKVAFDSVRPITAIPFLFAGQQIHCWGGPGAGVITTDGRNWVPYQAATFPTPPFPEFLSGHSTFSAAAAEVLLRFTHKDAFGASMTFAPGTSKYEPGFSPKTNVTLSWGTFSEAADEAGVSRRYGGIHFEAGDLAGRALGRVVGRQAWEHAQELWDGGKKNESKDRAESN
ncbi:MAG TPA: vanadium-dependent haloperoxidase [Candidatus Acidoferrum sp.]|nr:vanadium-dependent haloperoxidase [Candidatus Acidoferrum sp.]